METSTHPFSNANFVGNIMNAAEDAARIREEIEKNGGGNGYYGSKDVVTLSEEAQKIVDGEMSPIYTRGKSLTASDNTQIDVQLSELTDEYDVKYATSAKVNLVDANGTIQSYILNESSILTKNEQGQWQASQVSTVLLSALVVTILLSYLQS